MANRQYETRLLISGDGRGGARAVKLTDDALKKLEARQLAGTSVAERYARAFGNVTKSVLAYGAAAAGVTSIILFPIQSIRSAAEYERQLVAVGKTTGIVGAELARLGANVDQMSRRSPQSASRMLTLAEAAGTLGVTGSKNILKFTDTLSKMELATDVAGEDGAKSIARILTVTGDGIDTVDRFGSVLVALGNNSAASEREILRMTSEVARSTSQFKIGATAAAGLSAGMKSLSITAELGGSSVGRTMQTINDVITRGGPELDKFARKFSLTGEQLKGAWDSDKVAGFTLFLEGVAKQGLAAGQALDSVGLGGAEISKTIIPMAQNLGVLRSALSLAADEAERGTALSIEYNTALQTLDAQAKIFGNIASSSARQFGQQFVPALTNALRATNDFVNKGGLDDLKIKLQVVGEVLDETFGEPGRSLVKEFAEAFSRQLMALSSFAYVTSEFIYDAFSNLPANLKSIIEIVTIEVATLIDRIKSIPGVAEQAARNAKLAEAQQYFKDHAVPYEVQVKIIDELNKQDFTQIVRTQEQISNDRIKALNGVFENRKKEQAKFVARLEELRKQAISGADSMVATSASIADTIADPVDKMNAAVSEGVALTAAQTDEFDKLRDTLFPVQALVRDYEEKQKLLNSALAAGKISAGEHRESMVRLARSFEVARAQADPFAREWERAIDRIDDAFFDLFRSAFSGWGSFKDQLLDSAKDLVAQLAYQFAKQKFGFSSSQLAISGFSGGAGGSLVSGIGSIVGSVLGKAGLNLGAVGGGGILGQIGSNFGVTAGTGNLVQLTPGGLTSDLGPSAAGWQFNPVDFLKSAGLSIAGSFVGGKLGTALTGKEANSSWGAAIGSLILPGIGSAIGAFLDSAFGSKPADPWFSIAPSRQAATESFDGANLEKIVSSAFGGVRFRTEEDWSKGLDQAQRQSVFDFFDAISSLENTIASQLTPAQVSAASSSVGQQAKLTQHGAGNFETYFAERFNRIFDSIGGDIDATFDRLKKGLSNKELVSGMEGIVATTFELVNIQKALDVDVFKETNAAIEQQKRLQSEQLRQYEDSTNALIEVTSAFDNSATAAASLSQALAAQRASTVSLLTTYSQLGSSVTSTFGGAIDSIRESVLSDEELYNKRRSEIADLVQQLTTTIDPTQIGSLSSEIASLASSTFSSLAEDQKTALASEFANFLTDAQQIARDQIASGLDEVTQSTEIGDLFLQSALGIQGAAERFEAAVARFEQSNPQLDINFNATAPATVPAAGNYPAQDVGQIQQRIEEAIRLGLFDPSSIRIEVNA